MIIIDGSIILSGVFIFGASTIMYSLIALYIISILTDKVVIGISRNKAFYIVICVFLFFAIEGVADTTFTHNRGLFMLMLMGMSLTIKG